MIKKFEKYILNKKISIIIIFVFVILVSTSARLYRFHDMGHVNDEGFYITTGYVFHNLAKNLDFTNHYWYSDTDHPPLTKFIYGAVSPLDVRRILDNGLPEFYSDRNHTRFLSFLFNSLTILLTLFFCLRYLNRFVAVCASLMLALMPVLLGLSHVATIESILIFFYTLAIVFLFIFLEKKTYKYAFMTGFFAGMALLTKQSVILIYPLMFTIIFIHSKYSNEKKITNLFKKIGVLLIGSLISWLIIWPMAFINIKSTFSVTWSLWLTPTIPPPPIVYFGFVMFSPITYYITMYVITTPFLLYILNLIGLKKISDEKKWIFYALVVWFIFPFLLSFYRHRQHSVRYIIEFYVPFSIITAIGYQALINKISKNLLFKILSIFILMTYQLIILLRISPYYLDYHNILVGGAKGVYENKLFCLGWWGQGFWEAERYLHKHAEYGSKIGIPWGSANGYLIPVNGLRYEFFDETKEYDYVLANYNSNVKGQFSNEILKNKYKIIYEVDADGAKIVQIYKRKQS